MKEIKRFVDENGNTFEVEVEITAKDKVKRKLNDICSGTKKVVAGTVEFIKENPIICLMGFAIAVKGASTLCSSYSRVVNARTARDVYEDRDKTVYDNRSNMTYTLRRKMTNDEKYEFARRRRNGEDVGDILSDMRLI